MGDNGVGGGGWWKWLLGGLGLGGLGLGGFGLGGVFGSVGSMLRGLYQNGVGLAGQLYDTLRSVASTVIDLLSGGVDTLKSLPGLAARWLRYLGWLLLFLLVLALWLAFRYLTR